MPEGGKPKLRSSTAKFAQGVILALFLVPIAIGLPSYFTPLAFADAVDRLCGQVSFICAPSSFFDEAAHLASLGHVDGGIGLQAFRRLGMVITAFGAGALTTMHFATGAAKRRLRIPPFIPAIHPLDIPVVVALAGAIVWWTLLSSDIYLGGGYSARGPLRGTLAYACGIGFSSMIVGLGIIFGLRYTLLRNAFPLSGSRPSDEQ